MAAGFASLGLPRLYILAANKVLTRVLTGLIRCNNATHDGLEIRVRFEAVAQLRETVFRNIILFPLLIILTTLISILAVEKFVVANCDNITLVLFRYVIFVEFVSVVLDRPMYFVDLDVGMGHLWKRNMFSFIHFTAVTISLTPRGTSNIQS